MNAIITQLIGIGIILVVMGIVWIVGSCIVYEKPPKMTFISQDDDEPKLSPLESFIASREAAYQRRNKKE